MFWKGSWQIHFRWSSTMKGESKKKTISRWRNSHAFSRCLWYVVGPCSLLSNLYVTPNFSLMSHPTVKHHIYNRLSFYFNFSTDILHDTSQKFIFWCQWLEFFPFVLSPNHDIYCISPTSHNLEIIFDSSSRVNIWRLNIIDNYEMMGFLSNKTLYSTRAQSMSVPSQVVS